MKRTNLSVESETFEKFSRVAREQNKTIFAFANETLDFATSVYNDGGSLADVRKLWNAFQLIRSIDVLTLPSDFVDEINQKLMTSDENWTSNAYFRLGSNVGALLRFSAQSIDSLSAVAENFFILLPVKHFKMTSLEGTKSIQIDIAGAGHNIESAKCTAEFLKGILSSYEYEANRVELNVGTVRIWAVSKEKKEF
ncbi:MAG: hypothetical protein JRN68_05270 [Nitrososphaerota archaeon]|nr:hypothetical protein [Nitrososphaerota archaeon]